MDLLQAENVWELSSWENFNDSRVCTRMYWLAM